MSELQPETEHELDQEDLENVEETEDREDASDSESAPDDTGETPAVTFTEEQQRFIDQNIVGKKVYKLRQAERERDELRQELEKIQQKQNQETRPEVPDLPDPYSVDESQLKAAQQAREEALRKQAAYDARQEYLHQQEEQVRQQQQKQQQEALYETAQSYSQRAVKLGVKPEELQSAGNAVAQFGVHEDVANFILQDEHGPLITKYLSQNLAELDSISRMTPTQAAVKIATDIKQKASRLRPKVNEAPDPLDTPASSGKPPRARGPKGAVFE